MKDATANDQYSKYLDFEGPSDEEIARADSVALASGSNRARRNRAQAALRELVVPGVNANWGFSRHQGAFKKHR